MTRNLGDCFLLGRCGDRLGASSQLNIIVFSLGVVHGTVRRDVGVATLHIHQGPLSMLFVPSAVLYMACTYLLCTLAVQGIKQSVLRCFAVMKLLTIQTGGLCR